MAQITIAAVNVPDWQRDSDVELRIFSDTSFSASDGSLVIKGDPSENTEKSDNWFVRAACTLAGGVLTIAQLQLYSTDDSDQPQSRWQAYFYTTEGERIGPFGEFQSFVLPARLASQTTWAAIASAQQGPSL